MASGSWEFNTSSQYIRGRIRWSGTSNGAAANSSTVTAYLDYMKSSASTAATYGTFHGSISVNGSAGGISCALTLYANNSWVNVGSRSVIVGHDNDGSKSINISGGGGISGTTFGSSSTSNTVTLDRIPRYTTITSWNVTEVGQTYAKFGWSTADIVDFVRVYLNNSAQWTDNPGSVNTTFGAFTYTGSASQGAGIPSVSTLKPGTTYNLKVEARRKDSQLWTTSGNCTFTTAPIAQITNQNVNFNIGSNLTITFRNHTNNKSYLALDVQDANGNWVNGVASVSESVQTASYTWQLSTVAAQLFQKVTTRKSADIRIRCGTTINGTKYENDPVYGIMLVTNSNPGFSTYSYGDANAATQAVLGNASYMPQGFGNMQIHISAANRAIAKNYASIVKYTAEITTTAHNNKITREVPYSSSQQVDISFEPFSAAGTYTIKTWAVDSRGNTSPAVSRTFYILPYHEPQRTITMKRANEYEKEITLSFTAYYSRLLIGSTQKNNSFVIKYRYAEAGAPLPDAYTTLTGFSSVVHNTTDMKVTYTRTETNPIERLESSKTYNFEFLITDRLISVREPVTVSQGIPIFMEAENGKVSVGMIPEWDSPANFQVATDILATDSKGTKKLVLNEIDKTNDAVKQINNDLLARYHVGALIFDTVNVNPSTYLHFGTWSLWGQGKMPVGIDIADADFNVPEQTGGEKKHMLTVNEIPSHTHTQDATTYVDTQHTKFLNDNGNLRWCSTKQNGGNSGTTLATGGSQSHNNMPPYITCYIWKRIK